MDSVIVDHRLGIGSRLVGRLMKTPFAGGQFSLLMLAVGINKDDLVFRQLSYGIPVGVISIPP